MSNKIKVSYKGGGLFKKKGDKIVQKEGKTAEGDTKIGMFNSKGMSKASPKNQAVEGKDRTQGIKEVNAKLAEAKKAYQALSPEEKKGEKGKALVNQMRILRDSKRGAAAGASGVARNVKGEYYKS